MSSSSRNSRNRPALAAASLAFLALGAAQVFAADAYGSPAEIHPLLLGSEVPSVEVLALDGTSVDLKSVVAKKRAVVIFYRGGW